MVFILSPILISSKLNDQFLYLKITCREYYSCAVYSETPIDTFSKIALINPVTRIYAKKLVYWSECFTDGEDVSKVMNKKR